MVRYRTIVRMQDNVRTHSNNKEGVQDWSTLTSTKSSVTLVSSEERVCFGMEWMLFTIISLALYLLLVVSASRTTYIQKYCSFQLLGFCVSVVVHMNGIHV